MRDEVCNKRVGYDAKYVKWDTNAHVPTLKNELKVSQNRQTDRRKVEIRKKSMKLFSPWSDARRREGEMGGDRSRNRFPNDSHSQFHFRRKTQRKWGDKRKDSQLSSVPRWSFIRGGNRKISWRGPGWRTVFCPLTWVFSPSQTHASKLKLKMKRCVGPFSVHRLGRLSVSNL